MPHRRIRAPSPRSWPRSPCSLRAPYDLLEGPPGKDAPVRHHVQDEFLPLPRLPPEFRSAHLDNGYVEAESLREPGRDRSDPLGAGAPVMDDEDIHIAPRSQTANGRAEEDDAHGLERAESRRDRPFDLPVQRLPGDGLDDRLRAPRRREPVRDAPPDPPPIKEPCLGERAQAFARIRFGDPQLPRYRGNVHIPATLAQEREHPGLHRRTD